MTTDTASLEEIEAFLKQSCVLVGNTRNVCDKASLLGNFDTLSRERGSGVKSMFVAIVVDHFEEHKWMVLRYGVEQDRGGGCFLGHLPVRWWYVTLGVHKFLVFGVLSREDEDRGRRHVTKMCLLRQMIEQKLSEMYESNRDDFQNKVEVTQRQHEPVTWRQYEPVPKTQSEMDRELLEGWRRLFPPEREEQEDPPWRVMRTA